jgi:hypothetical protein
MRPCLAGVFSLRRQRGSQPSVSTPCP